MYWEIVELEDGSVALRQVDDGGDPMVTIKFSDEAKLRLNDRHVEVAKAMISAGMQSVGEIEDEHEELAQEAEHEENEIYPVIH